MKIRRLQKISDAFLERADAVASLPAKKIGPATIEVYRAAGDMKAERILKKKSVRGWESLRSILDQAAEAGDFSAFDDFAKAWTRLEVEPFCLRLAGEDLIGHRLKNAPRSKVTKAILFAIDILQIVEDRPPTRQEILHFLSNSEAMVEPIHIDDSELCTQLRKLGIQEHLPTASDLGS